MSNFQTTINPFDLLNQRFDALERMIAALSGNNQFSSISKPEYLNVDQAAKFLNLSRQTVYRLSSENGIPVIRKGKKLTFIKSELQAWLESGRKVG